MARKGCKMDRRVIVEISGERLDIYLARIYPDMTRSSLQRLIAEKNVIVNGKTPTKSYIVNENDEIYLKVSEIKPLELVAQDIPIDVVFEDSYLLVVNKRQGMVVHPASGNVSGTLVNALLRHCKGELSGINGVERPGIVHRLDKDTSGLMVVAKTNAAHISLSEQLKNHDISRVYEAVVYGKIKNDRGTIEAPIGRHATERKRMSVTHKNSRSAITHYTVIDSNNTYSYIQCRLETGRTHQIRVHLSYIGHPLVGDRVYAGKRPGLGLTGQCLHSREITFKHPFTGEMMHLQSELPEYFISLLAKIDMLNSMEKRR